MHNSATMAQKCNILGEFKAAQSICLLQGTAQGLKRERT